MTIRRHPMLYIYTLGTLVVTHYCFCYPAATDRGGSLYHRLPWYWEYLTIYLAFLGVGIAPLFDDFDDFPAFRRGLLSVFCSISCFILATAFTNLRTARPHTGSSAGFWGVVFYHPIEVIVTTLLCLLIATPFVVCWESVMAGFWTLVRRFDDLQRDGGRTHSGGPAWTQPGSHNDARMLGTR
ncbi:MAG: hypothetical protein AB7U20_01795 [Planctomycetaceae bacterium]